VRRSVLPRSCRHRFPGGPRTRRSDRHAIWHRGLRSRVHRMRPRGHDSQRRPVRHRDDGARKPLRLVDLREVRQTRRHHLRSKSRRRLYPDPWSNRPEPAITMSIPVDGLTTTAPTSLVDDAQTSTPDQTDPSGLDGDNDGNACESLPVALQRGHAPEVPNRPARRSTVGSRQHLRSISRRRGDLVRLLKPNTALDVHRCRGTTDDPVLDRYGIKHPRR